MSRKLKIFAIVKPAKSHDDVNDNDDETTGR